MNGSSRFLTLTAAISFTFAAPAMAALTTGLELYYGFENDTLTAGGINDQSGNARNGSPVGVADGTLGYSFSTNVPSAIGSGMSLRTDGGDEIRADSPNYGGILGAGSRTVAAWVRIDPSVAAGTNMHIIEWGTNSTSTRYSFRRENAAANGQGGIRTEINGDFRTTPNGGVSMNDGNWHHVATVFDNSGGTTLAEVTMYFDGTPIATYVDGGSTASLNTTAGTVLVGGSTLVNRRWNGWLDEVGVWSRPLSEAEIGELAGGATIPEPSAVFLLLLGATAIVGKRRRRS